MKTECKGIAREGWIKVSPALLSLPCKCVQWLFTPKSHTGTEALLFSEAYPCICNEAIPPPSFLLSRICSFFLFSDFGFRTLRELQKTFLRPPCSLGVHQTCVCLFCLRLDYQSFLTLFSPFFSLCRHSS